MNQIASDTMGVRSRSKKRRRRASAAGADRISGLCDDVLVRILELLPDAGDAVLTGALSRRWRGLWTRVGSLSFDSNSRPRLESADSNERFSFDSSSRPPSLENDSSDERFVDFVNDVLAQRAKTDAALDLEHLAISFAISISRADLFFSRKPTDLQPIQRCADAAHEWICYAMEKRVKFFELKLRLFTICKSCPPREIGAGMYDLVARFILERPVINLNDLPSSEKLETMHWDLKDVMVQLPDAAVFVSLVDLSLENVDLDVGNGHLLVRFLSSACCPSLQKLQLRNLNLHLLKELLIEASALLQLTMSSVSLIGGPETLKLKTPSLRILSLENFDHHEMRVGIFAPKLEEVTFLPKQPDHMEVDGELPCVERLKVIDLFEDEHDVNDSSICLLSCCTSLTCLEVSLRVTKGEGLVDNITERIPYLPHLISLTVHVYSPKLHSFGVGLAEILQQCSHLKYLRVHCTHEVGHNNDSFCDHPDQWKSHQMYLANIQEAEFTGLLGIECESWFMKRVLTHTRQLQKVALSFDPGFRLHNKIYDSMFVPCSGGRWICHDPGLSYEWNPGPI